MNWVTLKALNELYRAGQIKSKPTLLGDPNVRHLIQETKELAVVGRFLEGRDGFTTYYEKYHAINFLKYEEFLVRNDLLRPQTRFEESDIRILMDLEARMNSREIATLRDQIIQSEETVRGVSLMFFKNEKYLLGRPALVDAVKAILQIKQLANDRDQQYRYVLDCHDPKIIVLCENIDFLKRPTTPRQNHIELWYAGGKNIDKLQYADTRGLPIYYLCDWDYDGLVIYGAVRKKFPQIKLLFPDGGKRSIQQTEHKSLWKNREEPELLSGLDSILFTPRERALIQTLVSGNDWIIEESNNLIAITRDYLS